jgi:protein-tyrosine phosphatase
MDDSDLMSKKLEEQKKRIVKKGLVRDFMDEILPNLYLSDLMGALKNKDTFDVIINLSNYPYSTIAQVYNINIEDNPKVNIIEHIESMVPIIESLLKENKKVLIHCLMGKSRSASIIIGYLIKIHKMSYDEAVDFINNKRNNPIEPNMGFVYQLKKLK